MSEYESATLAAFSVPLWLIGTLVAVGLGLTIAVILEICKYDRREQRRFREQTRRHVKVMREFRERQAEFARRHAESTLGVGRVIDDGHSPDDLGK